MKRTIKLDQSVDAFGNVLVPGSVIVYYTGDEACLKVGQVIRMYDSQFRYTWQPADVWRSNVRVIVKPHDRPQHEGNIGNRLCMVQE